MAADQLPRLLVLEHAKVPGFGAIDPDGSLRSKTGSRARVGSAGIGVDVLAAEYETDAHVVMYGIVDPRQVPEGTSPLVAPYSALSSDLPRLTRSSLALFEHLGAGGVIDADDPLARITTQHVVGLALILDVDNPNHMKWTPAMLDAAQAGFDEYGKKNPLFARPSFWYTTSGGSRFGYFLTRPLMVEGAGGLEDRLAGLVATAAMAGLKADQSCKDWTRLMRLPCVRRGDKPRPEQRTMSQSYFRFSWGKVDVTSRTVTRPTEVVGYNPDSFRPLSAITVQEMQATEEARALANVTWRGRIGYPPRTFRDHITSVPVGQQPTAADLANAFTATTSGKETRVAKRAQGIIDSLANPKAKDRIPSRTAAYVSGILYEDKLVFAQPDQLDGFHQGILRLTRALCECLREHLGDTEEKIGIDFLWALAVTAARKSNKLRIDAQRSDAYPDDRILNDVWNAIVPEYQRQIAFLEGSRREREEAEDAARERAHEILRGRDSIEDAIKTWITDRLITSIPDEMAQEQARSAAPVVEGKKSYIGQFVDASWNNLLLLVVPNGTCVLQVNPQGEIQYSTPYSGENVFMGIRDAGHSFIQPYRAKKDLEDVPTLLPLPELKHDYATAASYALSRTIESATLRGVKNVHTGEIGLTVVGRAPGMRQDIRPAYDAQVDEWLNLLAGPQYIDKLLDWLAAFPKIQSPCAGLFIQGDKDIGKGMLGQALMRLTESGKAVDFSKAVHEFQDEMIDTPFLWADENIESGNFTKSVMNTYKKIITGEFNSLNPKGEKPVTIEGHWRVLLTGNTDKLLRMDDASNNADLAAVVQRLVYVKSPNGDAARFIRSLGGRAGVESMVTHRIPAHVLYLAEMRKVDWGSRLLVEGVESDYHKSIANTSTTTDITIRALGHMLHRLNEYSSSVVLKHDRRTDEIHLYVLASQLRPQMVAMHAADSSIRVPLIPAIEMALSVIEAHSSGKHYRTRFGVSTRGSHNNPVRCTRIDVGVLLDHLLRMGENVDYRKAFAEVHPQAWERLAPENVRREVEEDDADQGYSHPPQQPIPFVSPVGAAAPPLPPPAPPQPPPIAPAYSPRVGDSPNTIVGRSRSGHFSASTPPSSTY